LRAIHQAIQGWDVNVPDRYVGYGNADLRHAKLILNAVKPFVSGVLARDDGGGGPGGHGYAARLVPIPAEVEPGVQALLGMAERLEEEPESVTRVEGRRHVPRAKTTTPMLHITSAARNAGKAAGACVESVATQDYLAWRMTYLDGASEDDTEEQVREAIATQLPSGSRKVTFESSDGQSLEKLIPLWRSLPDDDVIVWLDGDDRLASPTALRRIAQAHAAGAIVTYGSFIFADGSPGWNGVAPEDSRARPFPWTLSHLRTFRAGAFKQIEDEDLRDTHDDYYRYSTDRCVMLPLWEMFRDRCVHLTESLVVYTANHFANASDHEKYTANEATRRIHLGRPPYARSDWLPGDGTCDGPPSECQKLTRRHHRIRHVGAST
jgi:hypothetical protein